MIGTPLVVLDACVLTRKDTPARKPSLPAGSPLHTAPVREQIYGTITTGAREKANFRPSSSTTLTWHVYRPGASFASAVWNWNGAICGRALGVSVTRTGSDSEIFVFPR